MPEWFEILWRSLLSIVVLFLMTRMLGKKQLSQLNFFHYIVGITIGDIAGFISLQIEEHFLFGVIAILVWTVVPFCFEWLSLKSKTIRDWFDGKGTILIKDGDVLEDNLKKSRFTADELLEELRKKDAFRFADVEFAVLETDGSVSVLMKRENQPLTPKDIGLLLPTEREPQTVIMDGSILKEPLSTIGLNESWLMAELDRLQLKLDDVFLAQVDANNVLTTDLYDSHKQGPSTPPDVTLWRTFQSCVKDLERCAQEAATEHEKKRYRKAARSLSDAAALAKPDLQRK